MGCTTDVAHTVDLRLEPLEGRAVELLVWGAVGEAVCNCDVREELQYAALHGQLVQVGIQEGEDALGQVDRRHGHSVRDGSRGSGSWLPAAANGGGVVGQARVYEVARRVWYWAV
jgi:hypothetical protein